MTNLSLLVFFPLPSVLWCFFFFFSAASLKGHAYVNADKLLSSEVVGSVEATVPRPSPSNWVIATDGSATLATDLAPATAGWGFVVQQVVVLEGIECECWVGGGG